MQLLPQLYIRGKLNAGGWDPSEAQPVGVSEAFGTTDHRAQKRHQGVSRRDGVGRGQSEGHGFLKFGSKTGPVEKLDETAEAAKGSDGLGGGTDLDWF